VKLSFVLILFVLVLSGASQSAQKPGGQILNEYKIAAIIEKNAPQNQRQAGAPTAFEKSLIESLRTIADQQKAEYEQRRADQKPWWIDPALLGVGCIYTVFAGFQWWAIRRQADITERTITHLERPWLIVRPGTPENWPFHIDYAITKFPINIAVMSSVSNVGRSPAFLVQQHINVVVASIPSETDQPQYTEPKPFAELMIEPKGVHSQRAGENISEAEFKSIITGQQCIMFFGFVKYFDVNRKIEHCTRFCSYWHKRPNDTGTDRWAFSPVGPRNYIEYT
jgi:hypothetical protein